MEESGSVGMYEAIRDLVKPGEFLNDVVSSFASGCFNTLHFTDHSFVTVIGFHLYQ